MTDPAGEFNQLLSAGLDMVNRLSTGSGAGTLTPSMNILEVRVFQTAWNTSRDLVVDELDAIVQANTSGQYFDPAPGSSSVAAVRDGLDDRGQYGPLTATALALTLWARLGTFEAPAGIPSQLFSIPPDPRNWPTVWASNHEFWVAAFTQVIVAEPLPPPIPTPEPEPLPAVISPPAPPPPPMVFEGETVYGQAKGEKSNAPLVIAGLGLLLGGGVIAYTASRKRRRA